MQHEATFLTAKEQVAELNRRTENYEPAKVLHFALRQAAPGQIALVSSFGAEPMGSLHMVSLIDPSIPMLFIDTQMLFKVTIAYQTDIARQLDLSDVRLIRPDPLVVSEKDPNGTLNRHNKDACCVLRKSRPLQQALTGFDTWITGRKRFQSDTRSAIEFFEEDGDHRIKVNPLAHWQPKDLHDYTEMHHLPPHPLISQGYASIGCAPCTSPVTNGENARAGRWRESDKTECGIHFSNGEILLQPLSEELSS